MLYNHWTPEKPDAKYPNLRQDIALKMSDRFVYDGSYMRLKNLELSYNIPCSKSRVISKARVYVEGAESLDDRPTPSGTPDVNAKGGSSSPRASTPAVSREPDLHAGMPACFLTT